MSEPIILIDVSNLVFRMHYAFHNLSSEGRPTGVIYGFLRTIHDLRQTVSKRMLFMWDHGVPMLGAPRPRNWRDDVIKQYKANRTRNQSEWELICPQMILLSKLIPLLGYYSLAIPGLEADDMIGIVSGMLDKEPMLIFSTDKDFYQLVDDRCQILVPQKEKGDFRRICKDEIETTFGILIEQWGSYLALGGDSADNIKPARGMGPKTAIKIIKDGGQPLLSFAAQRRPFKEKWMKLEPIWLNIQESYQAAQLPRHFNDERLTKYVSDSIWARSPNSKAGLIKLASQNWNAIQAPPDHREWAKGEFEEICADLELQSILAIRHKYFV